MANTSVCCHCFQQNRISTHSVYELKQYIIDNKQYSHLVFASWTTGLEPLLICPNVGYVISYYSITTILYQGQAQRDLFEEELNQWPSMIEIQTALDYRIEIEKKTNQIEFSKVSLKFQIQNGKWTFPLHSRHLWQHILFSIVFYSIVHRATDATLFLCQFHPNVFATHFIKVYYSSTHLRIPKVSHRKFFQYFLNAGNDVICHCQQYSNLYVRHQQANE